MSIFDRFLNKDKAVIITLSEEDIARPISLKAENTDSRVSREQLERASQLSIISRCISEYENVIMSTQVKPEVVCDNEQILDFFNEFITKVGTIVGSRTWDKLLSCILEYLITYGMVPVELIYNTKGTKILDLEIIDPKRFDYARDGMGNIALDAYGKPKGYTQKLPGLGVDIDPGGDPKPEGVVLSQERFFSPERIALFKFKEIGDGFNPYGPVEQVYKHVRELEAAHTTFMHIAQRYPLLLASVGDQNHEPRPEMLKAVAKAVSNADYKHGLVTAHYNKLSIINADIEKLSEMFNYSKDLIIAGMGVPYIFATGKPAKGESRATLRIEAGMFTLRCEGVLRRLLDGVEQQIFRRISELEGFDEVPEYVWGTLNVPGMEIKLEKDEQDVKDQAKQKEDMEKKDTSTSEVYGH